MKPVNFGIDLGTTNSLISRFDNGNVTVYKNPVGHKETLASVVAFRNDRILVGDKAREYMLKDAVNVFGGFKRRMGTDEQYYVVNLDENVTPVQLSTYVLQELQRFVHGAEKPEAAVITIPASFDTMQSNATRRAGMEAGLSEVFLLQEPVAASLAYFNQLPGEDHEGHWIVYDLGGGTFDVALVQIKEGEMKVVDHEGNNFLGGLDFDLMIVEQLIVPEVVRQADAGDFETELSTPYGPYEKLYYELLYKAEEAKKELSSYDTTEIEFSATIGDRRFDFNVTITREAFNQLLQKRVEDTLGMLQQVLERNQLAAADIRQLILVGGSTYIPYVQQRLEQGTGIPVNKSVDPTTAVAVGAGYYAANKYYTPAAPVEEEHADIGSMLEDIVARPETELPGMQLVLSYSKMSKEAEEVLLVKVNGDYFNHSYRLVRGDGGFDTGFVPLKAKFTEFLSLLPGVANVFHLTVYDEQNRELAALAQELTITHGQYNIAGQPLPKDICIEVDDRENHTTRLELVFEKNSILPLKKTLYREISKTIKKGSDDKLIINIQEGDRYARPLSNLTIGCIEIQGKDLKSDLIKGSDIEIKLLLSDNRELTTEVFLVMTGQEFKNVFAISEKHISVARLREQFNDLETEVRKTVKGFNYEDNEIWAIQANSLLDDLLSHKQALLKLKDKERSDKKYVIAEAIGRISQEYDKIGGNERLQQLQAEYLHARDYAEQQLPACDFEQDRLKAKFKQLVQNESQVLRTRNPSILQKAITQLNELIWEILTNTISYLIVYFHRIKAADADAFTNFGAAQSIVRMADKALEQERFFEFRQHVYNLSHLLRHAQQVAGSTDFKGTGIG